MNRLVLLSSAALALAGSATASAQELNLANTGTDRPSIVEVRTGMDHAFLGELGYRRVLAWGERQILAGGDVAMPWAKPDLRDYRIRATLGAPLGTEHWKIVGWLSPTLRGTENAASDMAAFGADLRLAGGFYARRWFLAGEVGLDWVAATHITFRDRYRSVVYSGAKDGWYRATGGTAYTGLHGGVSFSSFDVIVRAGHPRTTALEAQTLPFYLTVGVNVPLGR
jgi:hypothetical protein